MIRAEISENQDIVLKSEFRDKDLVKTVPGARWDSTEKVWRVPLAWSTCKVLRGVFGDRLQIGERLTAWAWDRRTYRIDPALAVRLALSDDVIAKREPRLYGFQQAGVAFLRHAERVLLADEMGTGKTVQALIALRTLHEDNGDALPLLIVCPNTMKRVWAREIETWWPGLRVEILSGGAAERRRALNTMRAGDADVLIAHWEILRHHSRLAPYGSIKLSDAEKETRELNLISWRAVVLDEAHKMKNPQAKQTRAAWAVARQDRVRYRFALTGTPVANAPHDMWAVLHYLEPTEFASKTRYVDRWCLVSWNSFGGLDVIGLRPDTAQEFYDIVDPMMRRMPKELVLPQLPPKVPERRYVPMSTKQAKLYDSMAKDMIARIEPEDVADDGRGNLIFAPNPIAQLTRLVQFSSACATLDENGDVKLALPSNKVDALLEILEDLGPHEPVAVFAQSRQLIMLAGEALAKEKISHRFIVGGQNDGERQAAIDDFQKGLARVILCTVAAGGVGVTLTRARYQVFMQRDFSFVNNDQAEARLHRIGAEKHESIVIIDLISEDTVDERVLEVVTIKGGRLQEVVRDAETMKKFIAGDRPIKQSKRTRAAKGEEEG